MAESISYIYKIIDKFTPALRKINSAAKSFGQTVKKSQAGLKTMSQKLTSIQSIAASAATTIGGKVALDKYTNFATSMNKLESVTFATEEQMASMREMAKKLGAETQFTAGQAAEGMTYLAMAGLDTEKVLKAIPGALELAAAGGIDLGQAADIATNVLGQMGLQVEDLSRVNNVLAAAQSKANFNIIELFDAMRPIGTTASNLGISLEELTAHLGVMANAGEKGSIAGTLLRNALTEIAGASESQIALYKDLGINLTDFVNEAGKITNFKGLIGELQRLQSEGKLTVPILQDLYGDRGFRAMQILAGAGAESIDKLQKSITGTSASSQAASIQMKGLPGVLKSMSSAFEAINIAIFESGLDRILIDIGTYITEVARNISSANPEMLKIAGIIGLVGTVAGPVLIAFGALSAAIAAISIPLVAAVAAFAGVSAAIYEVWKNWDYLVMDIKAGVDVVLGFIDNMAAGFMQTFDDIINAFNYVKNNIKDLPGNAFASAKESIKDIPSKIGGKIKGLFGFGDKGVVAQNTLASKSQLDGQIVVSAAKEAKVRSASMQTNMPGNLGFNIAGTTP